MGPRRQGGVPEGCGRWCCGPHWGSGFGGNAESLQELPRVSVGRHGPDQWTGLLSAYTRACGAHTHTKVGIPSTAGLPTCPCGASAWFPWGLWAGSPTPRKMGRQDAGLVPGGVCGWPWGRGWENCPEETCLLQGDVAHCPGLASGRVGKPKAAHSVLCWWKRGLLSMGSACPGTQLWERTCASLPSETGAWSQGPGVERKARVPLPCYRLHSEEGAPGAAQRPGQAALTGRGRCSRVMGGPSSHLPPTEPGSQPLNSLRGSEL